MASQESERTELGEITNNNTAPMDEAERKRQERNRKQREYRARRKAKESKEIRQERNKRRREQRLFNRTETLTNCNNTLGADHACTSFIQASSTPDKENVFPDDNTDWLHTNHNYVRTRQPTYDNSCVPNNLSGHTLLDASEATPVGNSNMKKALAQKERYNNMDDNSKEILLQKKTEYSRKMRSQSASKQPAQLSSIEQSDIEFDSALFKPTNNESDEDDDHLEAPQVLDIDDLLADDEARRYLGEDGAFESYRVSVNGVDMNNNEDPYDYVYCLIGTMV